MCDDLNYDDYQLYRHMIKEKEKVSCHFVNPYLVPVLYTILGPLDLH